jgi:hypothetical protein
MDASLDKAAHSLLKLCARNQRTCPRAFLLALLLPVTARYAKPAILGAAMAAPAGDVPPGGIIGPAFR